ncbi:hypothetical protein F5Y15DRAFT_303106 [Xylariaceae sp. FL0016]|nr:hypothetical protein F5Y15DRAFT_303106 [Xylariaceae sp. FL0016]
MKAPNSFYYFGILVLEALLTHAYPDIIGDGHTWRHGMGFDWKAIRTCSFLVIIAPTCSEHRHPSFTARSNNIMPWRSGDQPCEHDMLSSSNTQLPAAFKLGPEL